MGQVDQALADEFKGLLGEMRERIFDNQSETMDQARQASHEPGDSLDQSSDESIESTEFRLRDRENKLVSKIDKALDRIDSGEYWDCESCEEPIGLRRLRARPVTNLCISCKEEQEAEEARKPPPTIDDY